MFLFHTLYFKPSYCLIHSQQYPEHMGKSQEVTEITPLAIIYIYLRYYVSGVIYKVYGIRCTLKILNKIVNYLNYRKF